MKNAFGMRPVLSTNLWGDRIIAFLCFGLCVFVVCVGSVYLGATPNCCGVAEILRV
jgi:hypothetical protein